MRCVPIVWRTGRRRSSRRPSVAEHGESSCRSGRAARCAAAGWLAEPEFAGLPDSPDALVDEMLASGRYALLLRPEMNLHLDRGHIVRAVRQLDEAMGLVPAGRVLLGPLAEQSSTSSGAVDADPRSSDRFLHRVAALYLDRHPVTNEQFQQFVNAGGYEKLEYWDEETLPALLDFVDETGRPGPRFWIEGRIDERRATAGRRRELVRSDRLRTLGRQADADRCRLDQGRRMAGRSGAGPDRAAAISVGRFVRYSPGQPMGLATQRFGRRR